jgi:hypothetical protein
LSPRSRLSLLSGWSCLQPLLCSFVVVAAMSQCMAAEGPERAAPEKRPLILAHYLAWYEAKPTSPAWGWHWTMNAFDPETIKDGKRSVASHYYPMIGPYDSGDPAVLEYHLLLMKLSGIDGVVADWYGLSDHADYPLIHRNVATLVKAAEKLGLQVAVCYEDQTIPKLVVAKKLSAADRIKQAKTDIDWLRKNWFTDPAYVRLDGKPLFLSFGADGLTDAEWKESLPQTSDSLIYLSEHRRRPNAMGAFDWPVPKEHPADFERFHRQRKDWPVAIPVAFPRFHDIYAEAKIHASWGRISDDEGRTFAATLRRALESKSPFVQIATWNDWGEGTGIEPTKQFGYRDVETVQRQRRELVDRAFRPVAEDLRLPNRLLSLRRRRQPPSQVELNEVAALLSTGSVNEARQLLERIEVGGAP